MRTIILGMSALALAAVSAPAFAEEAPAEAIKLTGNVAMASDYRFRGFSQTTEDPAIQGGVTATHESGLYAGVWASNVKLSSSSEFDFFAGYSKEVMPGVTADVGVLYYFYPQHKSVTGAGDTDFFEPYVNLTTAFGPATLKVGVNYAWDQSALLDVAGNKSSAIYFHAEPSVAIPNTPLGLNAHIGYAKSDAFPGGPDGSVLDYSVGATAVYKMLTFGVSYISTDVKKSLGKEALGADGAVVFSLTAAF